MGKILTIERAIKVAQKLKNRGQKIILTGGCFDILHAGHIEFLGKAKKLGGVLFVLLESDVTVQKIKGKDRPVNKQGDRAKILSSLFMVNHVVPLPYFKTDKDYFSLVTKLKPDIIAVTRGDPYIKKKGQQAKLVGGVVIEVMSKKEDYSTTQTIKKTQKN